MQAQLLGTATAFGLSGATGLNTTIPLLLVGLLARFGFITLSAPYNTLSSPIVLVALALLAVVEFIGDKLPLVDSALHAVQLPLAATAGAILFASQTSVIRSVSPELAILIGLLVAGSVHGVRATARPLVTGATGGVGNAFVSTAEDGYALSLVGASIFSPVLGLFLFTVLLGAMAIVLTWTIRHGVRFTRWVRRRGVPHDFAWPAEHDTQLGSVGAMHASPGRRSAGPSPRGEHRRSD
ncbi:MAG: DUF4126 domain-containing protein [Dehalococcoidia bacterium]